MGAWSFFSDFIEDVTQELGCKHPRPRYAGRPAAASPATGLIARHKQEQMRLVADALTIGTPRRSRIATRKAEQAALAAGKNHNN